MPHPVPVTVLTGFLGAGKTTLLNHILTANHGKKIAVIENEFGEVGVDQELVIAADEEIFETDNGCVCCTVRGDLIRILTTLAKRRDRFDAVLLETTGLADPGPVAQTFFADPEVRDDYRLDGIVTVVDALHADTQLGRSKEAAEQVAFADVILLNKTDLAEPAAVDRLEHRLRHVNRTARVHRTQRGVVPMDAILNIGAFDLGRVAERLTHEDGHAHGHAHAHAHGEECGTGCGHHEGRHDAAVTSVGLVEPGSLDVKRFNAWLSSLLQTRGPDLYRLKGIVALKGDPNRHVFQGVHMQLDSSVGKPWAAGEDRGNKLVLIGRNLDRGELAAGFRGCLA